jgi:hypothetical protein
MKQNQMIDYLMSLYKKADRIGYRFEAIKTYQMLYDSLPSDNYMDNSYQQRMDTKHLRCLLGTKDIADLETKVSKGDTAFKINELFG